MQVDADRLRRYIAELSGSPRPGESTELAQARLAVTAHLESFDWLVEEHAFETVSDLGAQMQGINLVAHHRDHGLTNGPRFCVGAHLDSRPDSPGADDNASAVATLLEIARLMPSAWPSEPRLDLELSLFDLEENGMLGGAEHARRTKAANVDLRGMVALEMLGYCDHAPNSQSLPKLLVGQYPDTGNFIAVVGNQNSDRLIDRFSNGMKQVDGLPVETLTVPDNGNHLQATRLSDHSPFWDSGYAALMITDTSFLRNPHYHTPGDTLETLDMEFLEQVAQGCFAAVREILATGL